jgi:hypothetical protein
VSDEVQVGEDSLGQCRRLAGVLTMTQDMLGIAREGDWQRVAELERQRRGELQRVFSEPLADTHRELVAEALAVILHLNEELMVRLADARESMLRRGIAQSRARSAIGEYRDVSRGSPA